MPITTARDIVKASMRKISVLGVGQSLGNDEAQDAFDELNNMLSDWSVDGDLIYTETRETFTLTDNKASYTVGDGADFDTATFVSIAAAYVRAGGSDYVLSGISRQQYAGKTQKDISSIPDQYYYDDNFPDATLFLYPAPVNCDSLTIYSDKQLSEFSSISAEYNMPAYYRSALIYNLATRLAPEYEKEASATVQRLAAKTLKNIKIQNSRNNKYLSSVNIPNKNIHGAVDRNAFISGR